MASAIHILRSELVHELIKWPGRPSSVPFLQKLQLQRLQRRSTVLLDVVRRRWNRLKVTQQKAPRRFQGNGECMD